MAEHFTSVNATPDRRAQRVRAAVVILGLAVLASIAATQYLAHAFAFHPALSGRIGITDLAVVQVQSGQR